MMIFKFLIFIMMRVYFRSNKKLDWIKMLMLKTYQSFKKIYIIQNKIWILKKLKIIYNKHQIIQHLR